MLSAGNAVRRFAHRDAIGVLQQALALIPKLVGNARVELEVQILQRVGDAHYALGAMSESALAYESAATRAARADLKRAQLEALSGLAVPAWYADPDRGAAVCQQAVEVSRSLGDLRLVAETRLAAASFRLIYEAWGKEDADACMSASEAIGRSKTLESPMYAYVLALQGDYGRALHYAEALMVKTANPTAYLLALGAKMVALIHLGRLGEVLRIVQEGKQMAQENGDDPWVYIFREAWVRALCFDFDGAQRLSKIIMRTNAEQHAAQPRTIAMVASGYAEVDQGQYEQALQRFAQVRDFRVTPKFFFHWYWRIQAQIGTCSAWLRAGNLASARSEADDLLHSALSTADPNLHALAWEMNVRLAMAEENWHEAEKSMDRALVVVENFEIPVAAWRVHATAWEVLRHGNHHTAAEEQRRRARDLILGIANSFAPEEPLRQMFLAAPATARVLMAQPRTTSA
jgi:tetratricopeptide (TPR) repeat protein